MKSKNAWIIILLIILVIILLVGLSKRKNVGNIPTGTTSATSTELTFSDQKTGISYKYSDENSMKYMGFVDWPPKLSIFRAPLLCKTEATSTSGLPTVTEARVIGGQAYCITSQTQGAAGNIYTDYRYQTVVGGQGVTLAFSVHKSQCLNYEEPEQSLCKQEQAKFNPDLLIDKIVKTIVISG